MNLSMTVSLGDLMTACGLLLTVFYASKGLNQWRADKTIRLLADNQAPELRNARKRLRDWIRTFPKETDWTKIIEEKFREEQAETYALLGELVSHYNKLGILLKMNAIVDELLISEVATNVLIFEHPLKAWLEVVRKRRASDVAGLEVGAPHRHYGRGVEYLIIQVKRAQR